MPPSDYASKLHLKETPHDRLVREEKLFRRAARQARKEERRANRASTSTSHQSSSSSSHAPPPPRRSASPPPNYQAYHRSQFEQHLRDLAAQDEGRASELASWETGDYGTGVGWGDEPYSSSSSSVPKRWASREDNVWNDPLSGGAAGQGGLDEDSYAEEMRAGMYRRKNPESVKRTERLAEEAERTAARLLKMKEEGDKLERERIKKLEARKGKREEKRFEEEREAFEQGWKRMLDEEKRELRWRDVPWPVHRVEVGREVKVGDMTVPAVREFLMPSKVFWELEEEEGKRRRKEVLRDAIRRYHPDKFSRYLQRVPEKEKEKVQQGVAQVSRVLMELMQAG